MSLIINIDWMLPRNRFTGKDISYLCKSYNLTEIDIYAKQKEYGIIGYGNYFSLKTFVFNTRLLSFLTRYCLRICATSIDVKLTCYNSRSSHTITIYHGIGAERYWLILTVHHKVDEYENRLDQVKSDIMSVIREFYLEKCLIVMLIGESYKLVFDLEVEIISYFRKIL